MRPQRACVLARHGIRREAKATPGLGEIEQVLVGGGERRALQCGHDGNLVGGVVDCRKDGRGVADLLLEEEAATAVEVVGDAGLVQRCGVDLQVGAGADEQADIAVARVSGAAVG